MSNMIPYIYSVNGTLKKVEYIPTEMISINETGVAASTDLLMLIVHILIICVNE